MPTASDEQMAAPPLGRQESGIKRPADAAAAAPASKEAKQEAAAAPAAEQQAAGEGLPPRKPSFKVMGHLVLAMKRFSNSINPTYTYGKRTSSTSSGGPRRATTDTDVASSRPKSPEDHDKYAFPDHGHRFDLLLKPLPPTEDEEA